MLDAGADLYARHGKTKMELSMEKTLETTDFREFRALLEQERRVNGALISQFVV